MLSVRPLLTFILSYFLFFTATAHRSLSATPFAPAYRHFHPQKRGGSGAKHLSLIRRRRRADAASDPEPVGVNGVGPANSPLFRSAAASPGVTNSLGLDQDPSPLSYFDKQGNRAYLWPTVDFGSNILYRTGTSLTDLYSLGPSVLYAFDPPVGTEAADLMLWDDDTALVTVSAISDNTIRAVTFSLSGFVNGTSKNVVNHGTVVNENNVPISGFDSHVFLHPNGKRYMLYSNHVSIRIACMTSYNTVTQDSILVSTSPSDSNPLQQFLPSSFKSNGKIYNTEAPSTTIFPNSNGSQTINVGFATGDFRAADYNTRLMYIDAAQDPLNAANWYLTRQAFLESSSQNQAYAPGSGGFFTGPTGTTWFAYGGYDRQQGQGGDSGTYPRTLRVQEAPATSEGLLLPNTPVRTPRKNTPGSKRAASHVQQ